MQSQYLRKTQTLQAMPIRKLDDRFLLVQLESEVDSYNRQYDEQYNYYFINPDTYETYGSFGIFLDSYAYKIGE